MITICVGSQKGGVGKTTTVRNLADILAHDHGKRVLMVDADPQASLTKMCGIDTESDGLYELLESGEPEVFHEVADHVWILPSTKNLVDLEREMRETNLLKLRLLHLHDTNMADVVLIDCAPSLSMLTINALNAADHVLVMARPQPDDCEGVHEFAETVAYVHGTNGGKPDIIGVLLNEFDGRLRLHRKMEAQLADEFHVLDAKIGRSIRIAEASDNQVSLLTHDKRNKQLANYRQVAQEVLGYVS